MKLPQKNDFGDIDLDNLLDFNAELNAPITMDEISKVILTLKNQKACSMNDNVLNEYLKYPKMLCYPFIVSCLMLFQTLE